MTRTGPFADFVARRWPVLAVAVLLLPAWLLRSYADHIQAEHRAGLLQLQVLTIRIVAGDSLQPVRDAQITAVYPDVSSGPRIPTDPVGDGTYRVERKRQELFVAVNTADKKYGAIATIEPATESTTIRLEPLVTATGRLVHKTTGEPLGNHEVAYQHEVAYKLELQFGPADLAGPRPLGCGGRVTTNPDGTFAIPELVIGQVYHVFPKDNGYGFNFGVERIKIESPGSIDLGDLRFDPDRRILTLEEHLAQEFEPVKPVPERLAFVEQEAQISNQHVLVVFGDPADQRTLDFIKPLYTTRRVEFQSFRTLPVPVTGDRAEETAALAETLGVAIASASLPLFVVVDEQRNAHAQADADSLSTEGAPDVEKLAAFLSGATPPLPDAELVLAAALEQAGRENKRVFLKESATWCGPCRILSRFLYDHDAIFSKDYVVITIDHRYAHADDVMGRLRPEDDGGIPWFVILDTAGQSLANSNGPDGNIGTALQPDSRELFLSMVQQTAQRITEAEVATLRNAMAAKWEELQQLE